MARNYRNRCKGVIRSAKYYHRWMTIRKRQILLEREALPGDTTEYGIVPEWHLENDDGYHNFHTWIEAQLKKHPELDPESFHLLRHDKTKQFGPDNCYLAPLRARRALTDNLHEFVEVKATPALVGIRRFTGWLGNKLEHHRAQLVETLAPPENCPMARLETLFHLR